KNQAWNFGIETGWVQTDLRFGHGSPDTFSATATDLGGYATYLSGGLFVDGVINANFLNLSDDLPELGAPPVTAGTHGTSWGGQVEAGYQMPIGASAFWEPVGSLSYVDTTFGSLLVPGGLDQMGGDTSFRGSLGARIGLTQDFQYYKVKFALTGRIWDEFENNPSSTLIVAGGPDFLNNDDLKGVFGEVSGQANLFTTTSGLSAFLTGGIKFKTDYEEGTVTIGARYQW
ncbi:MAG TPA: autotransporter outer membrane beta-barrel domain-containing protein, partial [Caulobacteraceae bacterium]|nr:autotransporter outer membrane beta-barrel domain-containing protein [Caulobacteraceae bacterium]